MAQQKDLFTREGRHIREWILDLLSSDTKTYDKASDVIRAMWSGIPSIHTDLRTIKVDERAKDLFPEVVANIFSDPNFPTEQIIERLIKTCSEKWRYYQDKQKKALHSDEDYEAVFSEEDGLDCTRHTFNLEIIKCAGPGSKCMTEKFVDMLKADPPDGLLAQAAATALGSMGTASQEVFDLIFDTMCKAQNPHFYSASLAKIIETDPERTKQVIDYLSGTDLVKIKASIQFILHLNATDKIMELLEKLAHHKDEKVRCLVVRELGNVGHGRSEAIQILLDMINHETGHNKSAAVESLATICNDPDIVVPILVEALDDDDYTFCNYEGCVESAAVYLLKFVDQADAALPILLNDIQELDAIENVGDDMDRIKLLGQFGGRAKEALPKLKGYYNSFSETDPEDWRTKILKEAVENIEKDL